MTKTPLKKASSGASSTLEAFTKSFTPPPLPLLPSRAAVTCWKASHSAFSSSCLKFAASTCHSESTSLPETIRVGRE
eukprot:CAMPEP_0197498528 /NCGR_PEP_ID=MMETSP1311-20131121/58241_1 /TAXON_ID=464262 /ORGANISM="Genus nov. species nov., Strain RCC856" /LENGTH=76 /DNA_ID=CAMNT_0043044233 /DNA_START=149 /DNA_END=379 /DNA_ORIENTATION=-